MYQVVPQTSMDTTGINWNPNTQTVPNWGTTTITYPPSSSRDMTEDEVTIEKVDNGYIFTTRDTTLVAKSIFDLTELLQQKFETKKENK